jgi:hypothetical protein
VTRKRSNRPGTHERRLILNPATQPLIFPARPDADDLSLEFLYMSWIIDRIENDGDIKERGKAREGVEIEQFENILDRINLVLVCRRNGLLDSGGILLEGKRATCGLSQDENFVVLRHFGVATANRGADSYVLTAAIAAQTDIQTGNQQSEQQDIILPANGIDAAGERFRKIKRGGFP